MEQKHNFVLRGDASSPGSGVLPPLQSGSGLFVLGIK